MKKLLIIFSTQGTDGLISLSSNALLFADSLYIRVQIYFCAFPPQKSLPDADTSI